MPITTNSFIEAKELVDFVGGADKTKLLAISLTSNFWGARSTSEVQRFWVRNKNDLYISDAWLVGTTYATDDRITYAGKTWDSSTDSNTGNIPGTDNNWEEMWTNHTTGTVHSAWALGSSYGLGDQVVNDSNLYQCIIAGSNSGDADHEPGVGANWEDTWVYVSVYYVPAYYNFEVRFGINRNGVTTEGKSINVKKITWDAGTGDEILTSVYTDAGAFNNTSYTYLVPGYYECTLGLSFGGGSINLKSTGYFSVNRGANDPVKAEKIRVFSIDFSDLIATPITKVTSELAREGRLTSGSFFGGTAP